MKINLVDTSLRLYYNNAIKFREVFFTMLKQEFIERLKIPDKDIITEPMYDNIEFVYTWHPIIDEIKGKDQIAKLYDLGGYRLIMDMLPTAIKARDFQEEIDKKETELRDLRFKLASLGRGSDE